MLVLLKYFFAAFSYMTLNVLMETRFLLNNTKLKLIFTYFEPNVCVLVCHGIYSICPRDDAWFLCFFQAVGIELKQLLSAVDQQMPLLPQDCHAQVSPVSSVLDGN